MNKFTHVVQAFDGEFRSIYAAQSCAAGHKSLDAVVRTDKYGGHRHEWVVTVNNKERVRTESLSAAIHAYNEVNNE